MDKSWLTIILIVTAGVLIYFIVTILVNAMRNERKESADRETTMTITCSGCGWKGRVSAFHKKCPNCGSTLS